MELLRKLLQFSVVLTEAKGSDRIWEVTILITESFTLVRTEL